MSDVVLVPFRLHARVSVVSQARQDRLTRPEMFPLVAHVTETLIEGPPAALKQELEDQLLNAFTHVFLARMREDARLRQKIGGTKWQIQIHEYTYKRV